MDEPYDDLDDAARRALEVALAAAAAIGDQQCGTEYLLYDPRKGFRWLVESDGHWSYVTAVPPGEVSESGSRATHAGKSFKVFQDYANAHGYGGP